MRLGLRGSLRIFPLLVAVCLLPLQARSQTSIWIDTDPGMGMFFKEADDALALAYALKNPRLKVEGISVTYGNSSMSQCLPVAKSVVENFAPNPKAQLAVVYPGAAGKAFLGMATEATAGLQLVLNKKKIVYVALGPLTNLAALLETRPSLAKNIDQIIWVAGRAPGTVLKVGDTNPVAFKDTNFEKDPESAAIVLAAKIPMTLVSRELASDFLFTRDNQEKIAAGSTGGKWLAKELDHWMTIWKTGWSIDGGPMPDVLPLIAVTQPSSLQMEPSFAGASMELDKIVTPKEGQTAKYLLVSPKSSPGQDRPVTNVRDIDVAAKENWLRVMTGAK